MNRNFPDSNVRTLLKYISNKEGIKACCGQIRVITKVYETYTLPGVNLVSTHFQSYPSIEGKEIRIFRKGNHSNILC